MIRTARPVPPRPCSTPEPRTDRGSVARWSACRVQGPVISVTVRPISASTDLAPSAAEGVRSRQDDPDIWPACARQPKKPEHSHRGCRRRIRSGLHRRELPGTRQASWRNSSSITSRPDGYVVGRPKSTNRTWRGAEILVAVQFGHRRRAGGLQRHDARPPLRRSARRTLIAAVVLPTSDEVPTTRNAGAP